MSNVKDLDENCALTLIFFLKSIGYVIITFKTLDKRNLFELRMKVFSNSL